MALARVVDPEAEEEWNELLITQVWRSPPVFCCKRSPVCKLCEMRRLSWLGSFRVVSASPKRRDKHWYSELFKPGIQVPTFPGKRNCREVNLTHLHHFFTLSRCFRKRCLINSESSKRLKLWKEFSKWLRCWENNKKIKFRPSQESKGAW